MKTIIRLICLVAPAILTGCGGGAANNAAAGDTSYPEAVNEAGAPDPRELVYCRAVEQRVAREDCEDLATADADVRRGAAAFNVPDPMWRGQTVAVHLVMDRRSPEQIEALERRESRNPGVGNVDNQAMQGPPEANLIDEPIDVAGNSAAPQTENRSTVAIEDPTPRRVVSRMGGRPETFSPRIGRFMRAELTGQGFEIRARTAASQEIPRGGSATWIWDVTAREGGSRTLNLITVAEGVVRGRHYPLARTPTLRTVTVEVTLPDRIWDALTALPGWIKLLTGVLVPLGGLLTAWYALPKWKRRRAQRGMAGGQLG